jgi:hypothetical protein
LGYGRGLQTAQLRLIRAVMIQNAQYGRLEHHFYRCAELRALVVAVAQ